MLGKLIEFKNNRKVLVVFPFVMLLLLTVFFSIMTDGAFSQLSTMKLMFDQAVVTGVVATGAVFIFATNRVNIALGGTTALAAIVAVSVYNMTQSVTLMVLAGIAIAIVILSFACLLSTVFDVNVVVVTVLMMGLLGAVQDWIMQYHITLSLPYDLTSALAKNNVHIYVFIAYFAVCAFLFNYTKIGRVLKFIGDNPVCGTQTGYNVNRYVLIAFIIAGVGAGLGAFLYLIRSGSVNKDTCSSLNMDAMLAIVLGGMPVTGGYKSKCTAGVVGALFVTFLSTGLLMMSVSSVILQAVRGICFIVIIVLTSKRPNILPTKTMIQV